MNKKLKR